MTSCPAPSARAGNIYLVLMRFSFRRFRRLCLLIFLRRFRFVLHSIFTVR